MKTKSMKIMSLSVVFAVLLSLFTFTGTAEAATASIQYRTHCQNVGWTGWSKDGATSGTEGRSLRMEAIQMKLSNVSGSIRYRTHCQNIGWTGWSQNGATSGTEGRSLRVEAIRIELTGTAASLYDIEYRTHCQNVGWTGWSKNGATSGTEGRSLRMEAIQIRLKAKASVQPANNTNNNQSATAWDYPMKNATCSWRSYTNMSWGNINGTGTRRYHVGLDLKSSSGNSAVYATANGKVVYKNYTSGNGYHVILEHTVSGKTVRSLYSHLSSYSACPGVGSYVSRGQQIGVWGNSGNSSGTHLHFAIYQGSSTDPYGYVPAFSGNKVSYGGMTFYNPKYVVEYDRLP